MPDTIELQISLAEEKNSPTDEKKHMSLILVFSRYKVQAPIRKWQKLA